MTSSNKKLTKNILIKRMFSDAKHYPYGFSRSGDFSIAESKALQQQGCLIAALVDGKLAPESEDDHAFIECALGISPPNSVAQKAWVKYQKRINRPKYAGINGTQKTSTNDDDISADIDDNISSGIDDDIDIHISD